MDVELNTLVVVRIQVRCRAAAKQILEQHSVLIELVPHLHIVDVLGFSPASYVTTAGGITLDNAVSVIDAGAAAVSAARSSLSAATCPRLQVSDLPDRV